MFETWGQRGRSNWSKNKNKKKESTQMSAKYFRQQFFAQDKWKTKKMQKAKALTGGKT